MDLMAKYGVGTKQEATVDLTERVTAEVKRFVLPDLAPGND